MIQPDVVGKSRLEKVDGKWRRKQAANKIEKGSIDDLEFANEPPNIFTDFLKGTPSPNGPPPLAIRPFPFPNPPMPPECPMFQKCAILNRFQKGIVVNSRKNGLERVYAALQVICFSVEPGTRRYTET